MVMVADINWRESDYLLHGNERQRKAHAALSRLEIFCLLKAYDPVLVGTIPIGIDVEGSDLDVICEIDDPDCFAAELIHQFGQHDEFASWRADYGMLSVVARFQFEGFMIEVFGQSRPVTVQHAYRHMVIEARLLALGNDLLRAEIRRLKCAGLKTEPAFVELLRLPGDPYLQLLELENLDDLELLALLPAKFS